MKLLCVITTVSSFLYSLQAMKRYTNKLKPSLLQLFAV